MSKVLHIVLSEKYVEGASYQENLLPARHRLLGHEVFVITNDRYINKDRKMVIRKPGSYINENGVSVTILKPRHTLKYLDNFVGHTKGLYKAISKIGPDIIMLHGACAPENYLITRYLNNHQNVLLYVDSHNDYYNKPVNTLSQKIWAKLYSLHAHRLIKYAKVFWGTTPWRVDYLQTIYRIPSSKTGLLIMGGDESQILGKDREVVKSQVREEYSIPQDAFLVVTGGTFDRRKQIELLMESVSQLEEKNIWLLAFGTPTEEMRKVFDRFKGISNIVQTGWLPSSRAYDMFLSSDLAFFPGTHSVLWEQAVACGTPIVVKHWVGMEHVLIKQNAILMDEITIDSIKKVILSLRFTPDYQLMKMNAEQVSSTFFLSEIAKKSIGLK